jgi:hypothetical protein
MSPHGGTFTWTEGMRPESLARISANSDQQVRNSVPLKAFETGEAPDFPQYRTFRRMAWQLLCIKYWIKDFIQLRNSNVRSGG